MMSGGPEDDGSFVVVGGLRGEGIGVQVLTDAGVHNEGARVVLEGVEGADLDVVCNSTFSA